VREGLEAEGDLGLPGVAALIEIGEDLLGFSLVTWPVHLISLAAR
jgi:hypothetical protein